MSRLLHLVCLALLATAAHAGDARALIDEFHAALAGVAASQPADFDARFEALVAIVDATHDLESIARLTLGLHWNELDELQRAAFIERFRELSIATYASRFGELREDQFEVLEFVEQPRGRQLVRAQLHIADREPLGFDYLLHRTDEGWRIVNIVVDGVSDLALKRAEYARTMRDGDFDALLALLDEQTARQRSTP